MATRIWVAIGCMASIEFGDLCSGVILYLSDLDGIPGLPLPTIAVTAYALVSEHIMERSTVDCDNFISLNSTFSL